MFETTNDVPSSVQETKCWDLGSLIILRSFHGRRGLELLGYKVGAYGFTEDVDSCTRHGNVELLDAESCSSLPLPFPSAIQSEASPRFRNCPHPRRSFLSGSGRRHRRW